MNFRNAVFSDLEEMQKLYIETIKSICQNDYNELEVEARKNNSKIITSDISITAKPFFEKKGFIVKAEQKNIRHNVELINYKMEKKL